MGQLAGRPQTPERRLAGTSQTLFMEPCADCGVPVTIVGGAKPDPMRCPRCAAAAAEAVASSPDVQPGAPAAPPT